MTENNQPTDFVQPHQTEYQIQHMTEDFEVWNTIETYSDFGDALQHAHSYADSNPEAEVQIVETKRFNY